jgi:uncharacterized protein (UPF0335 family)
VWIVSKLAAVFLAVAAAGVAAAASLAAPNDETDGRYTMSPADGGFIRLDRVTGVMTFCKRKDDQWACEPMADGSEALRREIDRLEAENKALKSDKQHLEDMLGVGDQDKPGAKSQDGATPPAGSLEIPTEQDVDKMFDYIEGMVRKFKERIERLEKKSDSDQAL